MGEALDENFSALAEKEQKKKGLTNGTAAAAGASMGIF